MASRSRPASVITSYSIHYTKLYDTAGNQPDLFIVEYVQPLERNKAIQGYDLGQEPARRQALAKAVETNEPTLSNHIIMAAKDGQPGFLLLLPVYRNGAVLDSAEQRRNNFV